jgi:hypothetical protein
MDREIIMRHVFDVSSNREDGKPNPFTVDPEVSADYISDHRMFTMIFDHGATGYRRESDDVVIYETAPGVVIIVTRREVQS